MTGARYDRFRTWLRMLCTYVRDSGFETYWKYVCDGYEAGLNRPLMEEGDRISPVFYTQAPS